MRSRPDLRLLLTQKSLLLQVLRDDPHSVLHARLLTVDVDLWLLWCLIRRADARELLDLARAGLLVETLGVALLCFFYWDVDEDFNEGERGLGVLGVGVQVAGELAVGGVRRDEGGECDGCAVGKELGDLSSRSHVSVIQL